MPNDEVNQDRSDVEELADALLNAVEDEITIDESASPDVMHSAALAFQRLAVEFVRRYNRLDVTVETHGEHESGRGHGRAVKARVRRARR